MRHGSYSFAMFRILSLSLHQQVAHNCRVLQLGVLLPPPPVGRIATPTPNSNHFVAVV